MYLSCLLDYEAAFSVWEQLQWIQFMYDANEKHTTFSLSTQFFRFSINPWLFTWKKILYSARGKFQLVFLFLKLILFSQKYLRVISVKKWQFLKIFLFYLAILRYIWFWYFKQFHHFCNLEIYNFDILDNSIIL